MKLTKRERDILLEWSRANMDCDVDNAVPGGYPSRFFKDYNKAQVKKEWALIIKKLKAIR